MCRKCGGHDLTLTEDAVAALGTFRYWREPTPIELEFGDFERVEKETNDLEVQIAETAKPYVREIVAQIIAEATRAIRTGDTLAVSALSVDATDLAKAIKSATAKAIDAGRRQVFDQYRQQTGKKLASLPPRMNPRLSAKYLSGKSAIQAQALAQQAETAAQKAAISQIGRGVEDVETLTTMVNSAAEQYLVGLAREDAREGVAVGRTIAAQDTVDEIENVIYSALLDRDVCDTCASKDGDEYGGDELGQTPNGECTGEQYGNVCRCLELIVYQKG